MKKNNINDLQNIGSTNRNSRGMSPKESSHRRTYPEVDRDEANLEAELGETVVVPEQGFFNIGGEKHSNGGTPLYLPGNSFIFTDRKEHALTGEILENFTKSPSQKLTPAQISKQYDLNKYLKVLKDVNADYHEKTTAQLMVDGISKKLSELAIVQEAAKGFPSGIPNTADVLQAFADGGPHKGDKTGPRGDQTKRGIKKGFNKFDAPWLKDLGYSNDWSGFTSAVKSLGYKGGDDDISAMQKFLVEDNYKKGNMDLFKGFYADKGYGRTNKGAGYNNGLSTLGSNSPSLPDLLGDLVDGYAGVRTGELLRGVLGKMPPANPAGAPAAPVTAAATPAPWSKNPPQGVTDPNSKKLPLAYEDYNVDLGLNGLQKMDVANTVFDAFNRRKGKPTRFQNYGLEQAQGIAQNVMPYDYQSVINEAAKAASMAFNANSMMGVPAQQAGANNAAIHASTMGNMSSTRNQEYNQNAQLYNQNQANLQNLAAGIGEDKMKNAMVYNDSLERMNDNYYKEGVALKNLALGKTNAYLSDNLGLLYDNMLHPQYQFDPKAGWAGKMSFNPRNNALVPDPSVGGLNSQQTQSELEGTVSYLKERFKLSEKEAVTLALQTLRSNSVYDDHSVGNNTFMNPMLRSLNPVNRVGRTRGN
jgi:hypothetical protein